MFIFPHLTFLTLRTSEFKIIQLTLLNNLCFHSSKLFTLAVNMRYSAIFQPGYQEDSEKGEKIRVVFFSQKLLL